MTFAKIKSCEDGHTESNFYICDHAEMVEKVRREKAVFLFILPFIVRGKNYGERKESLRDLAIEFQYSNDGETDFQLSMGELAAAERFFEREGRKYGLLREFRENAII